MKREESEGRSHIVDITALIAVTSHPLVVRGDWSICDHSSRFHLDTYHTVIWEVIHGKRCLM